MKAYVPDSVYIEDEIKGALSLKQIEDINLALNDTNDYEQLSVAGLTMMVMQGFKGQKIAEAEFGAEEYKGYSFCQYMIARDDEESRETFEGWTREDYLRATRIANVIKETMLSAMLDIFEKPQNFTLNGSTSIADILSKNEGKTEGRDIIVELSQNCGINLNGTRMQSNMARMREVLEQNIGDYSTGTIQSIPDLVSQVTAEMSNPNITDETARREGMELEQMEEKKGKGIWVM